jgi:class 3 adenylate cyclase
MDDPIATPDRRASGANPSRRRLRAIFAADVANFGGMVSIDETNTIDALQVVRQVAIAELARFGGWLFGMPGDGVFALFESSVDAVGCALSTQARLTASPMLSGLKLRIGIHLGEVLFRDELPFGEALVIAARLESLAEPGGILVSAAVMDAVAPHIAATFVEGGVRTLKHSPRRVATFRVLPPPPSSEPGPADALLDRSVAPGPAARKDRAPPVSAPPDGKLFDSHRPKKPNQNEAAADSPSLDAEAGGSIDSDSLDQLIQLLTIHLGPLARLLVRGKAANYTRASQLIRALAQEIPSERERSDFLTRAEAVANRPH